MLKNGLKITNKPKKSIISSSQGKWTNSSEKQKVINAKTSDVSRDFFGTPFSPEKNFSYRHVWMAWIGLTYYENVIVLINCI